MSVLRICRRWFHPVCGKIVLPKSSTTFLSDSGEILPVSSYEPPKPSTSDAEQVPDWAGADREALVFNSFADFVPVEVAPLPGIIFNAVIRPDIVHRVVVWQAACRRRGIHNTKTRAEVSGGGRKPRPQKGTGRSRQGSIRSPLWVHGGVAHGPKPKDYSYQEAQKLVENGMRSLLTSRFMDGRLWIVRDCSLPSSDPDILHTHVKTHSWKSFAIIDARTDDFEGVSDNLADAAFFVPEAKVLPLEKMNVYDIIQQDHLVISKPALERISSKFRHLYCYY
ncbi:hypothetical protein GAYE_SCF43G5621 [Galdieria yellowstonensis]|uniref:Large ribosomal subunit protein uL4m n=1 Tax=Galdieria yellowstonensis TaxID=3028027 RepID=A0AAV9IJM7_9RHOD|nr:hypothetical protein GAYE_SCF43G5621 [Galdieria yellowstonensis]